MSMQIVCSLWFEGIFFLWGMWRRGFYQRMIEAKGSYSSVTMCLLLFYYGRFLNTSSAKVVSFLFHFYYRDFHFLFFEKLLPTNYLSVKVWLHFFNYGRFILTNNLSANMCVFGSLVPTNNSSTNVCFYIRGFCWWISCWQKCVLFYFTFIEALLQIVATKIYSFNTK